MALSEAVTDDPCGIQRRFLLSPVVARMLVRLEARAQQEFSSKGLRWPGLFVISGHRPTAIRSAFNPNEPPALKSFHLRCPALAADLRVGNLPASVTPFATWAFLGGIWKLMGGRWGGDFSRSDPNHFDFPSI